MRKFWCVDVLNTHDVVFVGYSFKTKRCGLRQTGPFFGENNCFWLLTVARGVVLNDHLKMLEMFMFVTGQ